ncbi:MAG: serine/threonine protein kinase, partial [Dehalococcoidia bacterium]|nr:serine/threonine protein kinase [Dehalococcoidia bacterium]
MASVYLATDPARAQQVALKLLRPYLSQNSSLVERFLQEMERVRELQHPNIRRVYEAGQAGDLCYVAMQYTPWENLRERLRYPLPPQEAPAIIGQVAQALDFALRQDVPHQDLKPSNIFVGPDLEVLVTDFGMDLLNQAHQTLMKTDVSSPMAVYRAPELAQGAPHDPYTDIYSLGVLAYELLTGSLPFNALTASTALVRQLTGTPLPPSRVNTTLPAAVDRVILRALNRRPEARFSTAQEFQKALDVALSPPDTRVRQTPAPSPSAAPEPARGEAVASLPMEAPAETSQVMVQICPRCGAANELSVHYCLSCWGRLIDTSVVNLQEAERLLLQRQRSRRRRLILRAALLAVPSLVLAVVLVNAFAVPPAPPPPVTDPTLPSDSRPGE